jgi:hypothetical protein
MINDYEVAEVMEVGNAHEVILGSNKLVERVPDSPSQDWREFVMEDDE